MFVWVEIERVTNIDICKKKIIKKNLKKLKINKKSTKNKYPVAKYFLICLTCLVKESPFLFITAQIIKITKKLLFWNVKRSLILEINSFFLL